jgi:hypothetical protein
MACTGLGGVAKPQVTVKIAGATVPTAMGSYCWSSAGHGECADMASIEVIIVPDIFFSIALILLARSAGPETIGPAEAAMAPMVIATNAAGVYLIYEGCGGA